MKNYCCYVISIATFIILTSMSECSTEGPITTIKGKVTDVNTGEPYEKIPLMLVREAPGLKSTVSIDFDSVITDRTGNYSLTFTPLIPGEYSIRLYYDQQLNKYSVSNILKPKFLPDLTLGEINTANFAVDKLINLTLRLKNSSNFDYTNFSLTARPYYCIEYFTKGVNIAKDTTLNFKVPRLTPLKITSYFFGGGKADLKNIYNLNPLNGDSTITITN